MAKVTGGLMSLGARGTIGKTLTFSGWKGQPYVRQTVTPANPNSAAQQVTRGTFTVASNIWKSGGSLLIAPWNRFAVGQKLTGRNAWMKSFIDNNRGQIDMSAMLFSGGAKGGVAPVSVTPTPGAGSLTIVVVPPTPPTGWTVTLCAAACIVNQDPETATDFTTTEGSDATDPYSIALSSLAAATEYVYGGWVEYAKPDGSVAYGPSIGGLSTTL